MGKPQDSRSDLFSLGVVLYEMVTGQRPFDAESLQGICGRVLSSTPLPPSHANPSVPAGFDQVVARCLAKDPEKRHTTAEALAEDLYPLARRAAVVAPVAPANGNGHGLRDRAARLLRSA
jgi:serine/threonine-protein kinase